MVVGGVWSLKSVSFEASNIPKKMFSQVSIFGTFITVINLFVIIIAALSLTLHTKQSVNFESENPYLLIFHDRMPIPAWPFSTVSTN